MLYVFKFLFFREMYNSHKFLFIAFWNPTEKEKEEVNWKLGRKTKRQVIFVMRITK